MTNFLYIKTIFLLALLSAGLTPLMAQQNRKVPGRYTDIVYRPQDGKIYGAGFDYDNATFQVKNPRLAAINPVSGQVEAQWAMPSLGAKVALSDDGSKLYVAMQDSILRFNFSTGNFDLAFAHQQTPSSGIYFIVEMIVWPGQPDVVVAVWSNILSNYYSVCAYDNGVRRGQVAQNFTNYGTITSDGQRLFAYDTYSTGSSIVPIALTPTGVQAEANQYTYVREFSKWIHCVDGRIYGSEGTVIGIQPDGRLYEEGILQTRSGRSFVMPGVGGDTLWVHSVHNQEVWLQAFDRDNLQLLSEKVLAKVNSTYQPDKVVMLNDPQSIAILSLNDLELSRVCTPQLAIAPNFPQGIQHVCLNDTMEITAPGGFPDERYYWSNGTLGSTLRHIAQNTGSTLVSYQIADNTGCLSAPSDPLQLTTVFPLPATEVGTEYGGSTLCAGGYLELKATPATADAGLTYEWSTGAHTRTIRVTTPGIYSCRVRDPHGCLSQPSSFPFQATSSPFPAPATPQITVTGGDGNTTICSSETDSKLTGPAGFTWYYWSDGQIGFEEPQRNIPAGNSTLRLMVGNSQGCISESSAPVTIQRLATPARPEIARSGNLLASPMETGNQWLLNGTPIPGANDQYFNVTQPGSYTLQTGYGTPCPSLISEPVQF